MDNIKIFIEKYDKNIEITNTQIYIFEKGLKMFWSIYHIVESTLKKFLNKICFYIYYKYIKGFKC